MAPTTRKGSRPGGHGIGKEGVGGFVREVLLAGEESDKGAPLAGDLIANGPAQNRVRTLERVEHRAARRAPRDGQRHLAVHPRERAEVGRQDHPDHVSDWTSTDRTAGRSRTMGIQLSPPSAEPYTWPPVVPKYTPQGSSESTAIASRSTFT